MFDINNIQYVSQTNQYICCCQCDSSQVAEHLCAKYTITAKNVDTVGEIYFRGSTAIIGSSNKNATVTIANYINSNYFMPPLDVYVFYGHNRKGLPDRWCIGFNHSNSDQLIDKLNMQHCLVVASKSPQDWVTTDKQSYSVILLLGVLDANPSKELDYKVNQCLQIIQNVTFRQTTLTKLSEKI